MAKKILFLDGDGTLWYPAKTLRTEKPHWIYIDPTTKDNYLEHLTLTPKLKEALKSFKKRGLYIVVISANPYDEVQAVKEIRERLEHFNLTKYVDAVRSSSGDDPNGKAAIMLEIIESLHLSKEDAVMVGDSYYYDYLTAKNIGIDAYFIHNTVSKMPEIMPSDLKSVAEVSDLVNVI